MLSSILFVVGEKKLSHFPLSISTEKPQKYPFFWSIFKVNSDIKSNGTTPCVIKNMPVPDRFNLHFVLDCEFFSQLSWTYLIGYVENTDPNPRLLRLLPQRYYRKKINCLALPWINSCNNMLLNFFWTIRNY